MTQLGKIDDVICSLSFSKIEPPLIGNIFFEFTTNDLTLNQSKIMNRISAWRLRRGVNHSLEISRNQKTRTSKSDIPLKNAKSRTLNVEMIYPSVWGTEKCYNFKIIIINNLNLYIVAWMQKGATVSPFFEK